MGDVAQRTYLPGLGEAYPAGATPMADYAYYTPDHLGSVRGIRLQDRSLSGSYAYEPYGQTRAASGLPLNVGYTGHLWDATIQQYFAPFRYYNPAAARWTMRDPLGLQDGINMYIYPINPVRFIDPLGLYCFPGWVGPAATVAGIITGRLLVLAVKSSAGVALGISPAGWAIATAVLLGVAAVTTVWNLRGQADEIINRTGAGETTKDYVDQINDRVDPHWGMAPDKPKPTPPKPKKDKGC
jgi:RHS repeat-associated protein